MVRIPKSLSGQHRSIVCSLVQVAPIHNPHHHSLRTISIVTNNKLFLLACLHSTSTTAHSILKPSSNHPHFLMHVNLDNLHPTRATKTLTSSASSSVQSKSSYSASSSSSSAAAASAASSSSSSAAAASAASSSSSSSLSSASPSPSSPQPESPPASSPIDFNDSKFAFQSKSLPQLLRGWLVFRMCQVPWLVQNSEALVKYSYKYLGKTLTNAAFKLSFFGHFCAGQDEVEIQPVVKKLEKSGVGSILDYAAESDIDQSTIGKTKTATPQAHTSQYQQGQAQAQTQAQAQAQAQTQTQAQTQAQAAQHHSHSQQQPHTILHSQLRARVYPYENEDECDAHMRTFEKAIRSVQKVSPTGFAAIKLTALANPDLLKRSSVTLSQLKKLFYKLDPKMTGHVTKHDFLQTFAKQIQGKNVLEYFDQYDKDHSGAIDYIEWTNSILLEELPKLTQHCTVPGPLSASVLTDEELELFSRFRNRIDNLATVAQQLGVRLMIDAEHSYFQPAIDSITVALQKKFNPIGSKPVIFQTYQMYLKDSLIDLNHDLVRAKKGNYTFAAKLVRGAYLVLERKHAQDHGLPDPIHDTLQDTHRSYNTGVQLCIDNLASGAAIEIMIASHNQRSMELALASLERNGLGPQAPVYFGQLYGMMDNLTFSLGAKGYKAYKYLPYGKVDEVMPYLIRRAQENAAVLATSNHEVEMINKELKRRVLEAIKL